MSFKEFIINYLSPIYVFMRFSLFLFAMAFFLIGQAQEGMAFFFCMAGALFFAWHGIRPWKTGATVNDVIRMKDDFIDKYK
jgi:hypothetical protein